MCAGLPNRAQHPTSPSAPMRLRVRRQHAERARSWRISSAAIRLPADARYSAKAHVLGDCRESQVVAHHQHVEMLHRRVHGVIGRVGLVDEGSKFGCPQALMIVGPACPAAPHPRYERCGSRGPLKRGEGSLDEARLVQGCRCGSPPGLSWSSATLKQGVEIAAGVVPPVFVQLQAIAPASICSAMRAAASWRCPCP